MPEYESQSARDAQRAGERVSYVEYLERHAHELRDYYRRRGDETTAEQMMTRTLSESLMGNDGP